MKEWVAMAHSAPSSVEYYGELWKGKLGEGGGVVVAVLRWEGCAMLR